jgi:thiol-disulfide isomerase/thioredoxin
MLTRLAITFLIAGLGWALYRLWIRRLLSKGHEDAIHIPGFQPGIPAILYFSGPDCPICKTHQEPTLTQLSESLGKQLQILTADVTQDRDLAVEWGILSLPTTFIIDAVGRARHVNNGFASSAQLLSQLKSIDAILPPQTNTNPGYTENVPTFKSEAPGVQNSSSSV